MLSSNVPSSTAKTRTWIDACAQFHREAGGQFPVLPALSAFTSPFPRGGPPPAAEESWSGSFAALEADVLARLDPERLERALADEVDAAQARMFCRRLFAVDVVLAGLADADSPDARVLRVGLHKRAVGILAASPPRASRVRALADFYYSQAGLLTHARRAGDAPQLRELVGSATFVDVAPGIRHATIDGPSAVGPVHVNCLLVDPRNVDVSVIDCRDAVRRGESFEAHAGPQCDAAISGGFFLYSEPDIDSPSARYDPVGLLVRDGVVENASTFARAAVLVDDAGMVRVRRTSVHDHRLRIGPHELTVTRAFNRATTEVGPDEPSLAIVGRRVVGRGRRLAVPLNGFVVPVPEHVASHDHDDVHYSPPALDDRLVQSGIAGGPMLVEAGQRVLDLRREDFWGSAPPVTFSQDETGDTNLLARMAVGQRDDGSLVAVAVDGRNFERALGMTLSTVAELMLDLGCHSAANMDGGSSKRMLIAGRTVDLPSTEVVTGSGGAAETRIRPVHTAMLFRSRLRARLR